MPEKPEPDRSERGREFRQLSLGLTIPALMVAGPLVGWALAWAAQTYLGAPQWTSAIGIAVGLAAGVRQVIHVIRDMNR